MNPLVYLEQTHTGWGFHNRQIQWMSQLMKNQLMKSHLMKIQVLININKTIKCKIKR